MLEGSETFTGFWTIVGITAFMSLFAFVNWSSTAFSLINLDFSTLTPRGWTLYRLLQFLSACE